MTNQQSELLYIWYIIYSVRQTNRHLACLRQTNSHFACAVISEERNQTMCYIHILYNVNFIFDIYHYIISVCPYNRPF